MDLSEGLPEGACGGFADSGYTDPLSLLAGRLFVSAPAGAEDVPRPHNIMAAPHAVEMESRVYLERGTERFVVFAEEMFRQPGADLVAGVRRELGDGYRVAPIAIEGLDVAVAVPEELDLSDEAVDVAIAFAATSDGLVQRVGFYVTPGAAQTGGCRRMGLALAETLQPGGRRLPDEPGPRVLHGEVGLDLLPDHRLVAQTGPDFTVYWVRAVRPLGQGFGSLGIYVGMHPSFHPPDRAERNPGEVFGQPIEWFDWDIDDGLQREALVQRPFGHMHLFMSASDPEVRDRLTRIAATLREGVRPAPLAACPATPMPVVDVSAGVLGDASLHHLAAADALSLYRRTWDRDAVPSAEAFHTLLEWPYASEAFAHLAVHGQTNEARVYGLLGLFVADRDRFETFACAVGRTLSGTVRVRGACGVEDRPVSALFHNPEAVRGQRHWSAQQWSMVMRDAPLDIRGGGLSMRMLLGPDDAESIAHDTWRLSGTGHTPALGPGEPSSTASFAEASAHPALVARTSFGGVCQTRRDGRVACWGSTPASERRGATLLPASLRWPRALAVDLGLGCVLDADGARTCFAMLDDSLQRRAEACPSLPAPAEVVLRRFDDGPWRTLADAGDVCGVREADGTLHCFVSSSRYLPQWAQLEGTGIGASYRVPVRGEIVGLGPSYLGAGLAWMRDGSIWRWSRYDAPVRIGRVEGVVRAMGGNDGEAVFAETQDGRVFVSGHDPAAYDRGYAREGGPFLEVPSLRGWRLSMGNHHVCALREGTVRCWGQRAGFAPGAGDTLNDHDVPQTEVEALRGARALYVGDWWTCGQMRRGLRCIGNHLDHLSNDAVTTDEHGPVSIRPDRIAAQLED